MTRSTLRIITRESPLAMWQACHVRDRLIAAHPGLKVSIQGISTEADRFLDTSLATLGGKGAFVKDLELALLSGHADLAVHSMKDVVVDLPDGLIIGAILEREDAGDAFVSNRFAHLDALPADSVIGTSSLRRQCQLNAWRPDLIIEDIRGNVGTRLGKLDAGRYDALVLAVSGLTRLDLTARIRSRLDPGLMLPAIGQGALGVEIRADDDETAARIACLEHPDTRVCVEAERSMNRTLNGGCHAPVAAWARLTGEGRLIMDALAGYPDGSLVIRESVEGEPSAAVGLGVVLGRRLIERGADRILREFGGTRPG